MATKPAKKRRSGLGGFVELIITVAIAVALAFLIQAFVVKPYRIPSGSMIPTLDIGQRILVNRLAGDPSLGDVIVFHPPAGATDQGGLGDGICGNANQGPGRAQPCDAPTPHRSSQTFVKRVVGLPGDRLQIRQGHVIRNGTPESTKNLEPCNDDPSCTFQGTIVVPPGEYYMMGDNRGASDDSRYWGPVPKKWIIGPAFFTYWPPKRVGTL